MLFSTVEPSSSECYLFEAICNSSDTQTGVLRQTDIQLKFAEFLRF
jgi:hypothetical protein